MDSQWTVLLSIQLSGSLINPKRNEGTLSPYCGISALTYTPLGVSPVKSHPLPRRDSGRFGRLIAAFAG